MAVTSRLGLLDESQSTGMTACSRCVRFLIAGTYHHADLVNSGGQNFLNDDAQSGLDYTVAIHQRLQRERPLAFARGGDDCFFDFHRD
jgi:hypothetical protein